VSNWFETPLGEARIKELQEATRLKRIQAAKLRNRALRGGFSRMYSAAKSSRLTSGWVVSNTSADSELVSSLVMLRARSRALVRDSSYAKRAKAIVVNNVIGTGIGMQAQVMTTRGTLNERVNKEIEAVSEECCYSRNFHTGAALSRADMERQLIGQVFEAGDVLYREHMRAFGDSPVPYAIELIESERIADDYISRSIGARPGNEIRMGVEVDRFNAALAYWVRERHPGELRFVNTPIDRLERVPADQAKLLYVVERWPQTRGEPWMHTAARRLNDMDGYSEAEIIRARAQAVRMGIIETPEDASSMGEEVERADGSVDIEMQLESGIIQRLNPGEKWQDSAPTAPNPQLDAFMRYMVREVAAGTGVSYESLSKDYSQSNYSSSRLALLDERDAWRALQWWFIREFRLPVHRNWLRQAVLSRAIKSISIEEYALDPHRFEEVRFRPRGWGWVDPTKEVLAFTQAVRSNMMTLQDVLATSGADVEEVFEQRAKEIALAKELGLVSDADPGQVTNTGQFQQQSDPDEKPPAKDGGDDTSDDSARVFQFSRRSS